jgi:MGT family glycosyltransferase
LNFVFALPAFVGSDCPNAELVRLVGPPSMAGRGDEVGFPWEKLQTDRPVIFISCGSVLRWQPDIIDVLTAATEPLGVQCVVSAGELVGKKSFPPHVLAVSYAPQLALLKRVDVFATVGGANSVNEALCAGVPMLMMPMLHDQHLQGHFIERAGVGVSIATADGTIETYRAAFKRLLDESQGFKTRSRALQSTYAQVDGGRAAADAIISYAQTLTS